MRWTSEEVVAEGVRERGFAVEVDGREVPGVLWLPAAGSGPRPLVLLGHGATHHKRVDYLLALGRALADWRAAIDGLRGLDDVGDGPVGYWGLSMGTIHGLPLVAAEPRIQVAVFGLMGLVGPTRDRMAADAASISCPALFIQQWDDSLIPRKDVLDLFDAIGSLDKRLHAHPGDHSAVPVEEIAFSVRFLTRHLAPHGGDVTDAI
jgi:fermentation-respiration switch protein FrsA (DUF1100 family)